jgi:Domain of unknown function (DUF5666)
VALAVGGVAVAAAATSDSTPSPGASASPSPGSTAAPGRERRERRERQPFLAGTVVSASGNTITITDFQGFQRTIHTSSSTTYEDGLTATPAAGTRIYAEGKVDSDKTSLAATKVGKLPDRPRCGPGRDGRGFPGRHHHDGDDPATTPSPGSSGTPAPPDKGGGSGTPTPSTPTPSPSGTA